MRRSSSDLEKRGWPRSQKHSAMEVNVVEICSPLKSISEKSWECRRPACMTRSGAAEPTTRRRESRPAALSQRYGLTSRHTLAAPGSSGGEHNHLCMVSLATALACVALATLGVQGAPALLVYSRTVGYRHDRCAQSGSAHICTDSCPHSQHPDRDRGHPQHRQILRALCADIQRRPCPVHTDWSGGVRRHRVPIQLQRGRLCGGRDVGRLGRRRRGCVARMAHGGWTWTCRPSRCYRVPV